MDKEVKDQLTQSLSETYIDRINPDKGELDRVLTLRSDHLASLADTEISRYIYTLSQYVVFLTVQLNARHIKFLEAKRSYEFSLAQVVTKTEAKTIKEKVNTALSTNEDLQKKEKRLRVLESDFILFEKVPEAVTELANALKKELAVRQPNRFR